MAVVIQNRLGTPEHEVAICRWQKEVRVGRRVRLYSTITFKKGEAPPRPCQSLVTAVPEERCLSTPGTCPRARGLAAAASSPRWWGTRSRGSPHGKACKSSTKNRRSQVSPSARDAFSKARIQVPAECRGRMKADSMTAGAPKQIACSSHCASCKHPLSAQATRNIGHQWRL